MDVNVANSFADTISEMSCLSFYSLAKETLYRRKDDSAEFHLFFLRMRLIKQITSYKLGHPIANLKRLQAVTAS